MVNKKALKLLWRRKRNIGTLWRRQGGMKRRPPWNQSHPPRFLLEVLEWRKRKRSTEPWMVTMIPTGQHLQRHLQEYRNSLKHQIIWESRYYSSKCWFEIYHRARVHCIQDLHPFIVLSFITFPRILFLDWGPIW